MTSTETEQDHGSSAGADFVPPAVAHLWEYQEQLDADGVMVAVSRQALDETLQKYLALIDVLTFCRDSMVEYGDGACGRNCEAMTDGPQFADEIASINAVLVDQPRPDRSPEPTTDAANLAEALTWVLPLAKGYAAGRDVAANQRIIQNAEEILAAVTKGTTAHQIEMAVARARLNRVEIPPSRDGVLAAWTAPGNSYPPYINLGAKGGDVIVVVRGDPKTVNGLTREGPTASMRVPRAALLEALTALQAEPAAEVINGDRVRQQALAIEIERILTRLPVRDCVDLGGELDRGRIREAAREIVALIAKAVSE